MYGRRANHQTHVQFLASFSAAGKLEAVGLNLEQQRCAPGPLSSLR
jgi:hypothetical protein